MRFPLLIRDEFGTPMMVVNDLEQLYDYMDEIDDGELYEVPDPNLDNEVRVFSSLRDAYEYNPKGCKQLHGPILAQWPEITQKRKGRVRKAWR